MKQCALCGKTSQTVNSRPHSKTITKRRQYPNLQTKAVNGKQSLVCTQCIKTMTRKTQKDASGLTIKVS